MSTPMSKPDADLIRLILGAPVVASLCDALDRRTRCVVAGGAGSLAALVSGAIGARTGRAVLLVVAHADEAEEAAAELESQGLSPVLLPAMEELPGESGASGELLAARIAAVRAMIAAGDAAGRGTPAEDAAENSRAPSPFILIAPIAALMQAVPRPEAMGSLCLTIERGQRIEPARLIEWLEAAGFSRTDAVEEPGEYAVRGGIVDIFPPFAPTPARATGGPESGGRGASRVASSAGVPIRLDFFGDEIDRLTEIDLGTMGSDRAIDAAEVLAAGGKALQAVGDAGVNAVELLPRGTIGVLGETMEVVEQGRGYYERLVDSRGVFGPPAVLALIERLHAVAEINQFSAGSGGERFALPAATLPEFARDIGEAIGELAGLAQGTLVDGSGGSGGTPTRSAGVEDAHNIWVCTDNPGEQARLRELVSQHAPDRSGDIETRACYVHRGFVWGAEPDARASGPGEPDGNARTAGADRDARASGSAPVRVREGRPTLVVPYNELLHRFHARRARSGIKSARAMDTFLDFKVGDYVVHADHGIALFSGLSLMPARRLPGHGKSAKQVLDEATGQNEKQKQKRARKPRGDGQEDAARDDLEEYLTLEFAGRSRLHVPATQIDRVQKYVGGFAGKPPLSTLGGTRWKAQKERVAESVRDLAAELLRVRAAREGLGGTRYPADTVWQSEFEAEFPYEETEDQLAALEQIKGDMARQRPMDRLICGDVGFGKTELAIRAAFKACEFGKQVAVLVPTTVLAEQHERTFRARFADYPFRVESLSRFKTTKEVNDTLAALRKGQVDVVIGTHRLLSKDVRFADLGLVVVDEEQRFGVEHKERLLQLRMTVDVLTLSATPIPRTLHMALLGIRDIASLTTPPADRRAIVTEVIPYNTRRITQAIRRELAREGQVFFVHNRVHNIERIADEVRAMAPGATVAIGHGQMPDGELEQVMLRFMRREADILVSTTIIESGIDIPTANTMIINDADRFGLAELHQLRGRVGRSKHRAYCYLLLPADRTINEVAQKRLKAIEQYSMLGAGFKIAMRDLEIRGAGNLLGAEQSGHIAAVGYEMYCHLLEEAVLELKNEKPPPAPSGTTVELGLGGLIPRAYIPSDQRRLEAYRRLAVGATLDDLARTRDDLTAAYGAPPRAVDRLFALAEIRVLAAGLGVRAVTIRESDIVFRAEDPGPVAERLRAGDGGGSISVLPPRAVDQLSEVYFRVPPAYFEGPTLLRVLARRLSPDLTRPGAAHGSADGTRRAPRPVGTPGSGGRG
ncbi:MAG: transcription-repair coupling factor [Phycisphaerales bacterium]